MTITQILGVLLLSSPLIGVTGYVIHEAGWLVALKIWGLVAAIMAALVLGSILVTAR